MDNATSIQPSNVLSAGTHYSTAAEMVNQIEQSYIFADQRNKEMFVHLNKTFRMLVSFYGSTIKTSSGYFKYLHPVYNLIGRVFQNDYVANQLQSPFPVIIVVEQGSTKTVDELKTFTDALHRDDIITYGIHFNDIKKEKLTEIYQPTDVIITNKYKFDELVMRFITNMRFAIVVTDLEELLVPNNSYRSGIISVLPMSLTSISLMAEVNPEKVKNIIDRYHDIMIDIYPTYEV